MALHALSVIGGYQSRLEGILFIKGSAMTVAAFGRLFGCRTVVVAPLAKRTFLAMKIIRQFVVFDIFKQHIDYLAVRKLNRFIFIRQCINLNHLRYIFIIKGGRHGLPGFQLAGGQQWGVGWLRVGADLCPVTVLTRQCILLAFLLK
jgi:hypothetical protein